jgi:hypothetical protein
MVVEDTTPFFHHPSERVRPFPGTALLLKTKNPRVIFTFFFFKFDETKCFKGSLLC